MAQVSNLTEERLSIAAKTYAVEAFACFNPEYLKEFPKETLTGIGGFHLSYTKKEGYMMAQLFTTSMDTLFTDGYTNNLWNLLPQHHSIGSDGWNTDCARAKKEFICPPSTNPPSPTRLYIFFYIALRQEALLWPSPLHLVHFLLPFNPASCKTERSI
ncbi:hypothetical protein YC2023_004639 [Brassica napus]